MRTLILHGDDRSLCLKELFCQDGHIVDYISDTSELNAETQYDIAVLPIPLMDMSHYMPIINNNRILKLIYASNNEKIINILNYYNAINVFDDESLVFYNARLTAEAALAIAIENGEKSIYQSNCLVSGFGRIGILLVNLLKALGANIVVATGSAGNNKILTSMDVGMVLYNDLDAQLGSYDFIFNTVPSQIFKTSAIEDYKGFYYELASSPYGFDSSVIGFNPRRLLCSKLPGNYFPHSAARGIYEVIKKYMR